MVQRLKAVVTKDVPVMPKKEEFASSMVQRLRDVVTEDVPVMPKKEEFVRDTEQKLRPRLAAIKIAPILLEWGDLR